jgi:hypothetical protein
MIMQHLALCTPCIALVNYGHLLHIRLDHTEPGFEEPTEQPQVEDFTNLELDQGMPRCI